MTDANEARGQRELTAAEIAAVSGGGTLLSDLAPPPPPPPFDGHINPNG